MVFHGRRHECGSSLISGGMRECLVSVPAHHELHANLPDQWKPKPPGALSPKPRPVPVSYAQSSMSSSQARPRTQAAIEARDPIPHIASQMVLDTEPNATFALASGSRSQTSGGVTGQSYRTLSFMGAPSIQRIRDEY